MQINSFETPILFIIFNNPETTEKVFNEIKKIKPKQLFLYSDGARTTVEGENEKCNKCREIVKNIDWDCDFKINFREDNVGPRIAVSSAINWFFDNVEEGIVLEHDCLPNASFFIFCREMLNHYRNDTRIMHISGNNFKNGKIYGDGSYYFSRIAHIWGFATWKRAWKLYDVEMKAYESFKNSKQIDNIFDGYFVKKHIIKLLDKIAFRNSATWDHQWNFALFSNNGLSINPNVNLIKNIGFGEGAVHCTDTSSKFADMKTEEINEIIHPSFILANKKADKETLSYNFDFGLWTRIKREFTRTFKF
ncbi:MAG: nucleotide-diphospho-sugar transferase [bacterium]